DYQVGGKMAVSLSGLSDDIYRSDMRPEGQIPANYILKSYDDQKHQRDLLVEWLKELLKSYNPEDIVLLSFCGLQNSLLNHLINNPHYCEAGNPRPNCIRYATISPFK